MAKLETIASKRPRSGSGLSRLCSTICTLSSPAKRSHAALSIVGEKSRATPSESGRSIRSKPRSRPSPVRRSRIRLIPLGTNSSNTPSPSVRCGIRSARARYFKACSAVAYSLRLGTLAIAKIRIELDQRLTFCPSGTSTITFHQAQTFQRQERFDCGDFGQSFGHQLCIATSRDDGQSRGLELFLQLRNQFADQPTITVQSSDQHRLFSAFADDRFRFANADLWQ